MRATINYPCADGATRTITADVDERRVEITQDDVLVGFGGWVGGHIVDGAARLGAPDGSDTEAIYAALDAAIARAS